LRGIAEDRVEGCERRVVLLVCAGRVRVTDQ
jgi:hypothetical protein